MNEQKIQRLDTEYHNVMGDIDRLIEANKGDFPRGHAIAELAEKADAIRARIQRLQYNKKTK
jgi:hypothetical protein